MCQEPRAEAELEARARETHGTDGCLGKKQTKWSESWRVGQSNQTLLQCLAIRRTAARLAQSVERKALNLVVVGSSPTVGVFFFSSLSKPHLSYI